MPRKKVIKKVSREEEIAWVARNLELAGEEEVILPPINEAPSKTAWSLLQWANQSDDNREIFWTRHYMQLLQKEKAQENKGFADDQRKRLRLFEQLERQMAKPKRKANESLSCFVQPVPPIPSAEIPSAQN